MRERKSSGENGYTSEKQSEDDVCPRAVTSDKKYFLEVLTEGGSGPSNRRHDLGFQEVAAREIHSFGGASVIVVPDDELRGCRPSPL